MLEKQLPTESAIKFSGWMAASSFHIERFQKELTHNESLQIETFHTTNPQISLAYEGPPIHTDFVQSWYFFYIEGKIHTRILCDACCVPLPFLVALPIWHGEPFLGFFLILHGCVYLIVIFPALHPNEFNPKGVPRALIHCNVAFYVTYIFCGIDCFKAKKYLCPLLRPKFFWEFDLFLNLMTTIVPNECILQLNTCFSLGLASSFHSS